MNNCDARQFKIVLLRLVSKLLSVAVTFSLSGNMLMADEVTGIYSTQDQLLILMLETQQDGTVIGLLDSQNQSFDVTLTPAEGKLVGAAQDEDGRNYPVLAQAEGGVLYFKLYEADAQGNVITSSGVQFDFYPQDNVGLPQIGQGNMPPADPQQNPGYRAPPTYSTPRQNTGAAAQLSAYLSGRHALISWRDGGALYGTYTFLNTHYCPNGRYIVYANTTKQSVLGGENRQNWQVSGAWRVVEQGGQIGVFLQADNGATDFSPMHLGPNGVSLREGITFVSQGQAQCY